MPLTKMRDGKLQAPDCGSLSFVLQDALRALSKEVFGEWS